MVFNASKLQLDERKNINFALTVIVTEKRISIFLGHKFNLRNHICTCSFKTIDIKQFKNVGNFSH